MYVCVCERERERERECVRVCDRKRERERWGVPGAYLVLSGRAVLSLDGQIASLL